MRSVAVVLFLLLAGCLQASDGLRTPHDAPWSLAFRCDSGTHVSRPGVCTATLGFEGDTWAEPFVATQSTDDRTFAVAVQGQAAQPADPDALATVMALVPGNEAPPATCVSWGICLYLTHDGGATWTRRTVGGDDLPVLAVDPVVAFAADGLVVAGLVRNGEGLAVQRSSDDGVTWSSVTVTRQENADRPWLGLHDDESLLVWQESGKPIGSWARSLDSGRTWSAPGPLPCNLHTRPVWRDDGWRVACSAVDRTLVLRIGADGDVRTLSTLPSTSGTVHLAQAPDGALWLAKPGSRPRAYLSHDGGEAWSTAYDLATPITGGQWSRSWLPWTTALPDGGLLAFVVVSEGGCVLRCPDGDPPTHVVHLRTDGSASALQLTPGSGRPFAPGDDVAGGEFNGAACQVVCVAAWMDDGLVDVAVLR